MTDYEYTLMDTHTPDDPEAFGEPGTAEEATSDLAFYHAMSDLKANPEYPADRVMVVRREIGTQEWEPVPDDVLHALTGAVV